MVLIKPGVWHTTVWADRTWPEDLWAEYGLPPEWPGIIMSLDLKKRGLTLRISSVEEQ